METRSQKKAQKYFFNYKNIHHPFNKIKFPITGVRSKITCHANKYKHMTHNEQQNQSIETCSEIIKMIELKMTKKALMFPST